MLLVHRAANADGATAVKSKSIAGRLPGCQCQLSCPNVYLFITNFDSSVCNRLAPLYCADGNA